MLPGSFIDETFREAVASLSTNLSLIHDPKAVRAMNPQPPRHVGGFYASLPAPAPDVLLPPLDGWNLATVVAHALDINLMDEVDRIFKQTQADCGLLEVWHYETMLIPFLSILPRKLSGELAPTFSQDSRIQTLHRTVMNTFLKRNVGKEPVLKDSWAREPVRSYLAYNIHRDDCDDLNAFLASPVYIIGRFPLPMYRQKKLRASVPYSEDYAVTNEVNGNVEVLVITKKKTRWKKMWNDWRKRC